MGPWASGAQQRFCVLRAARARAQAGGGPGRGARHSSAWPISAISREGGTVVTSCDSACASCARRFSFGVLPYTSLRARARGLASRLAAGPRRGRHGSGTAVSACCAMQSARRLTTLPLFFLHDVIKAHLTGHAQRAVG